MSTVPPIELVLLGRLALPFDKLRAYCNSFYTTEDGVVDLDGVLFLHVLGTTLNKLGLTTGTQSQIRTDTK